MLKNYEIRKYQMTQEENKALIKEKRKELFCQQMLIKEHMLPVFVMIEVWSADGTVNNIIINDYDYTIFCFWESILHRTEEFVQLIENTEVTLEEWHRQKAVRDHVADHS